MKTTQSADCSTSEAIRRFLHLGIVNQKGSPQVRCLDTAPCTRCGGQRANRSLWLGASNFASKLRTFLGNQAALVAWERRSALSHRTPESPGPTPAPCPAQLPALRASRVKPRDEVGRSGLEKLEKVGFTRWESAEAGPGLRSGRPSRSDGHRGAAARSGAGVACLKWLSHCLISRYPPPKSSLRFLRHLSSRNLVFLLLSLSSWGMGRLRGWVGGRSRRVARGAGGRTWSRERGKVKTPTGSHVHSAPLEDQSSE